MDHYAVRLENYEFNRDLLPTGAIHYGLPPDIVALFDLTTDRLQARSMAAKRLPASLQRDGSCIRGGLSAFAPSPHNEDATEGKTYLFCQLLPGFYLHESLLSGAGII